MQERQKISEGSYVKGSYFKVYANPSVFNGQPILNSLLESEGLEGMGHQLGGYAKFVGGGGGARRRLVSGTHTFRASHKFGLVTPEK